MFRQRWLLAEDISASTLRCNGSFPPLSSFLLWLLVQQPFFSEGSFSCQCPSLSLGYRCCHTYLVNIPSLLHQPSVGMSFSIKNTVQKKETKSSCWYLFLPTSICNDWFISFPIHTSSISVKNQRHFRNILSMDTNTRSTDKMKYLPCEFLKRQTISVLELQLTTTQINSGQAYGNKQKKNIKFKVKHREGL